MKNQLFLKSLALVACLMSALGASAYSSVSNGLNNNVKNSTIQTVEVTYEDTNYDSYINEGDDVAIDNVQLADQALRGDINGDGTVNVADVTPLVDFLLYGTPIPNPDGDCNMDGKINVTDVAELIDYLLNGTW